MPLTVPEQAIDPPMGQTFFLAPQAILDDTAIRLYLLILRLGRQKYR
jgi:hypothetical protein